MALIPEYLKENQTGDRIQTSVPLTTYYYVRQINRKGSRTLKENRSVQCEVIALGFGQCEHTMSCDILVMCCSTKWQMLLAFYF